VFTLKKTLYVLRTSLGSALDIILRFTHLTFDLIEDIRISNELASLTTVLLSKNYSSSLDGDYPENFKIIRHY
jgi:hypothetical protein